MLVTSRSLGVALRAEPVDLAGAINPVVAIFAAGQPFDVAVLVTGQHGDNLPVALVDPVRSELYFCFCHPVFMHELQEQRKLRCGCALFVVPAALGHDVGLCPKLTWSPNENPAIAGGVSNDPRAFEERARTGLAATGQAGVRSSTSLGSRRTARRARP